MIRRLFVLNLKALLSGNLKTGLGGKRSGRGKKLLLAAFAFLLAAFLFAIFLVMFYPMLEPCFSAGIGWMYFAVLALIVFALNVISTIFSASALIFAAKDNELLLSMPIRPSAVLISRLLVLLASEYLFALIAAAAAFIPWVLGGYATAAGMMYFVIEVLLLPLPALAVSLLLAWLLGLVSSRLRHKNVVTLAVSLGFLLAYFCFYVGMQRYFGELLMRGEEIAAAFHKAMPPFYAFGKGIADADIGNIWQFVLWAVLPFTASVFLISVNYRSILTTNRGGVKIAYKERETKSHGILSALTRKEIEHYLSRPMVILNCSLGALAMVIGAAALLIKGETMISSITEATPALGGVDVALVYAVLLTVLVSLNNLSASLISLEGRNLWIAKSLPAPARTVLAAKIAAHLLVTAPPCLFASVCAGIAAAQSLSDWLILLLLPQTFAALTATCGLAVNLRFPKLDWMSETHVVKQGLSAMIMLFGAVFILVGLGLLYGFILSGAVSLAAYLWLCALIFAAGAAVTSVWLIKAGTLKFAALD
jgi:ABC-2 type transport system permease protein